MKLASAPLSSIKLVLTSLLQISLWVKMSDEMMVTIPSHLRCQFASECLFTLPFMFSCTDLKVHILSLRRWGHTGIRNVSFTSLCKYDWGIIMLLAHLASAIYYDHYCILSVARLAIYMICSRRFVFYSADRLLDDDAVSHYAALHNDCCSLLTPYFLACTSTSPANRSKFSS